MNPKLSAIATELQKQHALTGVSHNVGLYRCFDYRLLFHTYLIENLDVTFYRAHFNIYLVLGS